MTTLTTKLERMMEATGAWTGEIVNAKSFFLLHPKDEEVRMASQWKLNVVNGLRSKAIKMEVQTYGFNGSSFYALVRSPEAR